MVDRLGVVLTMSAKSLGDGEGGGQKSLSRRELYLGHPRAGLHKTGIRGIQVNQTNC